MTERQRQILRFWEDADEAFPEKSTEFIMAITCDWAGCDHSELVDALWAESEEQPV